MAASIPELDFHFTKVEMRSFVARGHYETEHPKRKLLVLREKVGANLLGCGAP